MTDLPRVKGYRATLQGFGFPWWCSFFLSEEESRNESSNETFSLFLLSIAPTTNIYCFAIIRKFTLKRVGSKFIDILAFTLLHRMA